MKAVIMAGGEGTRLRPLTSNQPKPMLPVVNRPMMEHIVRLLREHGFDEIVVTVAFLANNIRTYFGDGSEFGIRMVYATEATPLGTAGSVRNAMDELRDERFLVISGDVLTDIDLSAIVAEHIERGALATIGLKRMENPLEFGIVITNTDGSIDRFLEKPGWGQVFSDTINTGIYVFEPEIFDWIEADVSVDWSQDVFPKLLEANKPVFGSVCEGYWEDVGTLDAYRSAHQDVLDGKVELQIDGFRLGDGVILGEGAEIHPDAVLDGPVVIGAYSHVDAGARLRPYSVLGTNVRVGPDAFVERAVVHDNAYLGRGSRVRGAVVGRNGDLRSGVRLDEGVILGDGCFIGAGAVINQGIKIYPGKAVEANAVVNSSIVWESKGARSLFGRVGLAGLANVDVTPELVVKVAQAYGTTLKKGDRVTVSRDTSRAGRVLKRAVMVGLNSAGVDVEDLEVATVPVTRFQVRTERTRGGITVRLDPTDPEQVVIRFFDAAGADLTEDARRKVERLYQREEIRRATAAEIGDIGFPPRALEYYTNALTGSVDVEVIKASKPKIVLDYSYGSASFVMPQLLAKLGAEVLAVNPFASTKRMLGFDRPAHAAAVGELVRAAGATLGAVIDPDGESVALIDDEGTVLRDIDALMAVLTLAGQVGDLGRIALPVSTTDRAAEIVAAAGGEVVWTPLATSSLLAAAGGAEVTMAADAAGHIAFPAFLPAFDGAATILHVLEMLAVTGTTMSKVVATLPRVHIAHEEVETPWSAKGAVMRFLVESTKDMDQVLIDGVKVRDGDGWTLALPDPDLPLTHVWAEGTSSADAKSRAQAVAKRIRQAAR